jgi:hypothetical protein
MTNMLILPILPNKMVIFHGYLKSPEAKSHISWEEGGHGLTAAGFGGPWLPRRLAGVEPLARLGILGILGRGGSTEEINQRFLV